MLSSQLGVTLAGANCPATYSGPLMGYWSFSCDLAVHPTPGSDASQQDYQYRRVAIDYAEHHEGRLLPVAAPRLGRELGLYRPFQQIDLEWAVLGRPRLPATLGLFAWYVTAALAVGGVVVLRRRRVPLLPLVVITADVLIVAVVTFGQTRYRTALDAVVVMLAGVAVGQALVGAARPRSSLDRRSDQPAARPGKRAVGRRPPSARSPAAVACCAQREPAPSLRSGGKVGGGSRRRRKTGEEGLSRLGDEGNRPFDGGLGAGRGGMHAAHLAHVLRARRPRPPRVSPWAPIHVAS